MVKQTIRTEIHDYARQLDGALRRLKHDRQMSEPNRRRILEFYEALLAEGLSKPRVIYYLNRLHRIAGWLKTPFDKATRPDIENVMRQVNATDYTEWTRKDFKVTLKKFFRWLRGCQEPGVYPPEVSWIRTHVALDRQELPNNLPDEDDARHMIEAAEHPRDKALISTLYESGCRIGEIGSLRLGDVQYDEFGAVIIVHGKTGSRRVRLVFSAPILASWINVHPDRRDPKAALWIVVGNARACAKSKSSTYTNDWSYELKYPAIKKMLRAVAKKAGITKKVNPHAWRHSRATYLANKLTEQQLKHLFGWTQSSRMAATYVHLSGRDVDDALLSIYGKKKVETAEGTSVLAPVSCPRCKEANEFSNVYCKKCGWTLDQKAAAVLEEKRRGADEVLSALTRDPATLKVLAHALAQLGLVDELKRL